MISLNKYLQEEGIMAPTIYLKFFFSMHTTEEDGIDVIEHSRSSDVIAVELMRWDIGFDNLLNKVSFGKEPPTLDTLEIADKPFYASTAFQIGLMKAVYGLCKPFIFFDLPSSNSLTSELDIAMNELAELYGSQIHMERKYVNKLPAYKEWCVKFADLQKKREEYMEASFMKALRDLLLTNPPLLNKDKLDVSLFLGKIHTTIYKHFKEVNPNTSIAFQYDSEELPSSAKLFLDLMQGNEVTDQEYQLAYIEGIATLYVQESGITRDKQISSAKILTKALSTEETQHLYTQLNNSTEAVVAFLKEKAMSINL